MTVKVTLIEFHAMLPDGNIVKSTFKTGLGPCGKTVSGLMGQITVDFLTITQTCDDGTEQLFIYKMCDIKGRIKMERNL